MITGEDVGRSDPHAGVRRRTRRRRGGRITAVIFAVVLVPLLVLGSGVAWFFYELDAHGKPGPVVHVQIRPGWGVPRIGEELHRDHIVGSSLVFNIYSRFNGDNSFQAGTYYLHKNIGVRAAVGALKRGPRINYIVLTVPPGLWVKQIAARVGRLPGRKAQPFLQGTHNNAVRSVFEPSGVTNLEGLLRPDTYKVSNSQDEISILQTMANAFDTHAKRLGLLTANVQGLDPYQIITVASLIEAEAKVPQDRPLIASVIYNRLAANMPLQIDSTVIYGRGNPANRKLTASDLQQVKSPYNTYLHTGLPPTPIGSVSDASLLSAMAPARTSYLYYVLAGKDGHHAFASTYAQQQQNIEAAAEGWSAVITGTTRLAGVIGKPVRHSLSPRLHNAAYGALGLDWVFVAFEVPDGGARAALDAARTLDLVGLAVTMPHKTAVAALCDDVSSDAAVLHSVNTVTFAAGGNTTGESTDGAGFLRSLADADVDVPGRAALVLGAGGAARAVARALAGCGARVTVAARRADAASEAAALADGVAIAWDDRASVATAVDIIVNATSVGMGRDPALPIPAVALRSAHAVIDLVYDPIETPLLVAARAQGARSVSGLGMLVHQAALQVERWSGQPAPIDAMRASVARGETAP